MRELSALSARVLVCSKWKITTSGLEYIPGIIHSRKLLVRACKRVLQGTIYCTCKYVERTAV